MIKTIRIDPKIRSSEDDKTSNWTYRGLVGTTSPMEHWTADHWWCDDGDGVELYINVLDNSFDLQCFSGVGISRISVDSIDYGVLWKRVKEFILVKDIQDYTFVEQSVIIADYFCRLFCEYQDVSSYKTL